MGTRSRIGIENADGTVTSVSCHWDGYLSHVGNILHTSYQTEEKIQELMGLGNLSSLGEDIGERHPFDNPYQWGTVEHEALERQCTFYGRDRGEANTDARVCTNLEVYAKLRTEYTYLWKDGKWLVLGNDADRPWLSLEEAIRMDSEEDER